MTKALTKGEPKIQYHFTAEMIASLEVLWKRNLSCSQLGVELKRLYPEFKGKLTSAALAGQVWRLRKAGRVLPMRSKKMPGGPRGNGAVKTRRALPQESRVPRTYTTHVTQKGLRNVNQKPTSSLTGSHLHGNGVPEFTYDKFAPAFEQAGQKHLRSLWELKDHDCHWPIEKDGKTLYCGNPVEGRTRYCSGHNKLKVR